MARAEPANRMILFEAELVFADCSNSLRGLFGIDQSPPNPGQQGSAARLVRLADKLPGLGVKSLFDEIDGHFPGVGKVDYRVVLHKGVIAWL